MKKTIPLTVKRHAVGIDQSFAFGCVGNFGRCGYLRRCDRCTENESDRHRRIFAENMTASLFRSER
jgi:hypothetical protein